MTAKHRIQLEQSALRETINGLLGLTELTDEQRGELSTATSNQTDGDFLLAGRLVPLGRKGNIVYARSLRPGEEDTGEGVHVKAGEQQLDHPARGELIINTRSASANPCLSPMICRSLPIDTNLVSGNSPSNMRW